MATIACHVDSITVDADMLEREPSETESWAIKGKGPCSYVGVGRYVIGFEGEPGYAFGHMGMKGSPSWGEVIEDTEGGPPPRGRVWFDGITPAEDENAVSYCKYVDMSDSSMPVYSGPPLKWKGWGGRGRIKDGFSVEGSPKYIS